MTDRTSDEAIPLTPRRTVLRGAVLAGVAVPFLVACSDDEPSSDGTTTSSGSDDPTSPDDSSSPPESTDDGGGGEAIASVSDVPEGGGLIIPDSELVVTQPTAGEFLGFTSICTHNSCPLDNVADGTINCVCHGSQFAIEDGHVVRGPSTNGGDPASISPLPQKQIKVQGDDITLA